MKKRVKIAIFLGLAFLGACDEGKIYPPEGDGREGGYSVELTGTLTGNSDYGPGFSLAVAVFGEGSDFAEISKGVSPEEASATLSNVAVQHGTAELCVLNSLRKRVFTLKSIPVSTPEGGSTLRLDAGEVDVSAYGIIAERVFATTCLQCHGATGHAAAGLDLSREKAWEMLVGVSSRVEEGMMRVAPGDPRRSTLWEAVATDVSARWSFNHSNLLPAGESGFIENWIEKGAEK